jgi:CRP-like cAMP-binding protein
MGSMASAYDSVLPLPPVSRPWLDKQPRRGSSPERPGEDAVETLRRAGQSVALGREETLFCEDEEAQAVYVVVSGTLRSCKVLPDGRRQIIGFHEAGELVGMSLGETYPYSAEGVSDVRLRRVGRRQLEELMDAKPQFRVRLLSLAARELAAAQKRSWGVEERKSGRKPPKQGQGGARGDAQGAGSGRRIPHAPGASRDAQQAGTHG